MDREARKKSFWSRFKKAKRKEGGSADDQPGRTDELAFRPASVESVRSAVDTADFLIVHDDDSVVAPRPPDTPDQMTRVRALRERVDTGDYAVHFEMVAEAMVARVLRLQSNGSGEE